MDQEALRLDIIAKFNNNIRCIEMIEDKNAVWTDFMFNNNIRCIEMTVVKQP